MLPEIKFLVNLLHYYKDLELPDNFYQFFDKEEDKQILFVLEQFYKKYQKIPEKYSDFEIEYLDLIENKKLIIPDYIKDLVLKKIQKIFENLNNQDFLYSFEIFKKHIEKVIASSKAKQKISEYIEKFKQNQIEELLQDLNIDLEKDKKRLVTFDDFINKEIPVRSIVCPTGFQYLDYYMEGGLALKEIALIGAPPGFGKSTFLLNILCNGLSLNTLNENIFNFIYVTLELQAEEIFIRILSILFDFPIKELKKYSPKELRQFLISFFGKDEVDKIFALIKDYVSVIYFEPMTSIDKILEEIIKINKENKVLFVDYLNEIDEPRQRDIWAKYEVIMTKWDGFINENNIALWIANQAHKKGIKQHIIDIQDLYLSKIGSTKKISFGIGLTFKEDVQKHQLNFFKNRLKGKISETTFIWIENKGSLKLTEELKIYDLENI